MSFKHTIFPFDKANFFLKLPSQNLFSKFVLKFGCYQTQTLFTHYLILKPGFKISASKFILKLCFNTLLFLHLFSKHMHASVETWSFCPINGKMVAG